ncbi:MAG: alpha/beta hydrolase [Sphingobacteriales bacterium]|nr:MAG: alpha/beta hydrolase [Sphingobacteriales bacterium]
MIDIVNPPYPINNVRLANGCNIAYIDEGKGTQTVLFIHGLASYGLSWRKNFDSLRNKYRCIAIDLPGNGFSDRGNYPYSVSFFANCLYELIEQLQLKNVCLAGHSMGGQIALHMVIYKPLVADKLVLCAPAGFETFSHMEKTMYQSAIGYFDMFSTEENSLKKSIYSSFYHLPSQGEEMINELTDIMHAYPIKLYRNMIDACVNGMLNEPVFNRLNEIKQPVLVMYGERDALIPNRMIHLVNTRAIAEQGAKQLQNATVHMIPQCGHFLQIEKAAAVNSYISDFLG